MKKTFEFSTLAAALLLSGVAAQSAHAQQSQLDIITTDSVTVRGHIQGGLNAVAEQNLYWELADTFAPTANFDSDAEWLEMYLKPGVSFETRNERGPQLYGMVSAVASYTSGTDAFDATDSGAVTLEQAYIGIRTRPADGVAVDLSLGSRELRLGTGMLVANGGSNGFERGALKFGPRKAWDLAAIARFSRGGTTFTGFFISPNERPAIESNNRLAGFDIRHDFDSRAFIGASFVAVTQSDSPYAQAAPNGAGPPNVITGAREGTNTINLYGNTGSELGNWLIGVDFAYQWNNRIDLEAWAARFQVGYTFADVNWRPSITYAYQTFSGDDPATPELERFDPLFYEGSPSAWATGSKSSMVYINSNVRAHTLALRVQPSQQDTVTLRYAHLRANELLSPLQFGQAARIDTTGGTANLVSGVTDAHLTDDFFIEYNRIISRNWFLTGGISVSFPGEGNNRLVAGGVPDWIGGFLNVVFNF